MKAIVVKPGQKDSIHMRDMPDPKLKPDLVAVKMLRVGLSLAALPLFAVAQFRLRLPAWLAKGRNERFPSHRPRGR